MRNIKKFESVVFWLDGIMERGRVLDVAFKDNELFFYVEKIRTHDMLCLRADLVFKEEECK